MTLDDLIALARSEEPVPDAVLGVLVGCLLDEGRAVERRADLLRALQQKGESADLLAGFARELLARATPLPGIPPGTIDVCGTGGDKAGLFNVSTAVMFVAAGAGARVAKHGNRGITSRSGGADALEALGVRIDIPPHAAAAAIYEIGCGFLFAPQYHNAVRAVAPVRKFLADEGTPTIFNLLGPLLNPAKPDFQMVGIYRGDVLTAYATALGALGRQRAWVLNGPGPDGTRLDEASPFGPTRVVETAGGNLREFFIDPAELGLTCPDHASLRGGDASENAALITSLLDGSDRGPRRAIVELNAAAALVVCGLSPTLPHGLEAAADSINSGAARSKLQALVAFSSRTA